MVHCRYQLQVFATGTRCMCPLQTTPYSSIYSQYSAYNGVCVGVLRFSGGSMYVQLAKIYEYLYLLATAHQQHNSVYVIGKVVVVC